MRTYDAPFQRVLRARTWRARFYEAAANASAKLVEYSVRREDPANATYWMKRLEHYREQARVHS